MFVRACAAFTKPLDVVLVVDESGSMYGWGPVSPQDPTFFRYTAVQYVLRKMLPEDRLAVVAFGLYLRAQMPVWRSSYPGVENMSVAVMGCVVNGPGESKLANIGISLPGTGELPVAPVYEDGKKTVTLKGDRIAEDFQALLDAYVHRTYSGGGPGATLTDAGAVGRQVIPIASVAR